MECPVAQDAGTIILTEWKSAIGLNHKDIVIKESEHKIVYTHIASDYTISNMFGRGLKLFLGNTKWGFLTVLIYKYKQMLINKKLKTNM